MEVLKKFRLNNLKDINSGHVFDDILPGKYIYNGGLSFLNPGERSHANDGPGKDGLHIHKDCEAFIILQGVGLIEINKEQYPVKTGDIIINEPGEDHHLISSYDEPLITLWCHAGPEKR